MECRYEIGDCVVTDDVEGEVIDVIDLGGDCFLKVKTPGGNLIVPCDEVTPCPGDGG